MTDWRILRSQRKGVYEALERVGIGDLMTEFQWSQRKSGADEFSVLSIETDTRKLYFEFIRNSGAWYPRYFPDSENRVETIAAKDWTNVLESVRRWAKRVAEELLVADPWADLAALHAGFVLPPGQTTSNEGFSMPEASIIDANLRHLEQQIASRFAKSEEDLVVIKSKLEYLIEAMARQGKTDWLHTAIGVFATMAMAIGVSAADADAFWRTVKGALDAPVQMLLGR